MSNYQDIEELLTGNKALYIHVPDFATGTFEKHKAAAEELLMTSFLRLGNFDYDKETEKSKFLLDMLYQSGPPGDPATTPKVMPVAGNPLLAPVAPDTPAPTDPLAPAPVDGLYFLDDMRVRDVDVNPDTPDALVVGNGLTQAQRLLESSRLYTRGGWRDHSDGNRITTTYGDKVEVIRGNYKMIVMGRQDDPGEGMGWDVGGSHLTDYAPGTMPGATFWHQWIPDYQITDVRTGVWLLVNTTENVYQFARNAGTFREEMWGNLVETYVGSENPTDSTSPFATDGTKGTEGRGVSATVTGVHYEFPNTSAVGTPPWSYDNQEVIRSNPHIIEKTWATRIDSYTGTEGWHVPEIHEFTFADTICGDTGSSGHRVTSITENTWATNTVELVDVAVKIMSNTRAGSIFEATTAGTIFESTTSALHASMEVGVVLDIYAGLKTEIFLGGGLEINVAMQDELILGAHTHLKSTETKVALKNVTTTLNAYHAALLDKNVSLRATKRALKSVTQALNVALGL